MSRGPSTRALHFPDDESWVPVLPQSILPPPPPLGSYAWLLFSLTFGSINMKLEEP